MIEALVCVLCLVVVSVFERARRKAMSELLRKEKRRRYLRLVAIDSQEEQAFLGKWPHPGCPEAEYQKWRAGRPSLDELERAA